MTTVLGNRTTAVHVPLEDGILVRIQVPQLNPLLIAGFCFKLFINGVRAIVVIAGMLTLCAN